MFVGCCVACTVVENAYYWMLPRFIKEAAQTGHEATHKLDNTRLGGLSGQ